MAARLDISPPSPSSLSAPPAPPAPPSPPLPQLFGAPAALTVKESTRPIWSVVRVTVVSCMHITSPSADMNTSVSSTSAVLRSALTKASIVFSGANIESPRPVCDQLRHLVTLPARQAEKAAPRQHPAEASAPHRQQLALSLSASGAVSVSVALRRQQLTTSYDISISGRYGTPQRRGRAGGGCCLKLLLPHRGSGCFAPE